MQANKLIDQSRWDDYGKKCLEEINTNSQNFLIENVDSFYVKTGIWNDLKREIGDLKGKRILEVGMGLGKFSVFLAKQGAEVTGIDIGENLVKFATELAVVNNVKCNFINSSTTNLDLQVESFDLIIGLVFLHHLTEENVLEAFFKFNRILKPNGKAIFVEPVENSRIFNFLQNLIPLRNRPSIMQRKAWKKYIKNLDDRVMNNDELKNLGNSCNFKYTKLYSYGLTIRLSALFGANNFTYLRKLDNLIFNLFPMLKRYCRNVMAVYIK